MNFDEIENMTVAALKKEMKTRNLPTTGNKGELVQRLSEYLANEEQKLLQTSTVGTGSDELLDIPEELLDTTIDTSVSKSDSNDVPAIKAPASTIEPKKLTTVTSSVDQVSSSADIAQVQTSIAPVSATDTVTESENDAARRKSVEAPLSESEKKILRAKKFNVPVVHTKEMRAERFGTNQQAAKVSSGENKTNASLSISSAKTPDIDTLKKRAERFGVSTTSSIVSEKGQNSENGEKLKLRALRFGASGAHGATKVSLSSLKSSTNAEIDDKQSDALLKRKQRFGSMLNNNVENSGASDAKKQMRAQRFGAKV